MRYMLANLLLALLPPTRCFDLKRALLLLLGIRIGERTRICGAVQFFGGGRVIIGRDCWVGLNVRFYTSPNGDVTIGDRCDIAPETCFMNGSHVMGGPDHRAGPGQSDHIEVGAGTWIGVRSILLGGTKIGAGCMVAAGSVVRSPETPPNSMLAGAPARIVRQLDT